MVIFSGGCSLDRDVALPWLIVSVISFVLVAVSIDLRTISIENKTLKREAIRCGYAEWKVDENGGTAFKWK